MDPLFTSCFQDPSWWPFHPFHTPSASHMADMNRAHAGPLTGCRLSLQQAATLDVLFFVGGAKKLDGLLVDQDPEVVKGDVLAALDLHLLQEAVQPRLALCNLHRK